MARKKKTEEVEPEVIVEETVATEAPAEEPVVEEKPKTTRKKKTTAKKVEEPEVVEEVKETTPAKKTTSTKKSTKKVDIEAVSEEAPEEVPETGELIKTEEDADVEVVGKKVAEVVIEPEPVKEVKVVEAVEEVPAVAEFVPYKAIVKSGILNVRVGPSINYHRVRDLYKNAKITVLEEAGNWGRIGKDLWVNINYIEKI